MRLTKSNISVIIPIYNEEDRLKDCLAALKEQSLKPLEIIVVDNNSTDQSVAIARTFKEVTVIKEKKQGMIYARNRGFNYARGDILARIDADTIVPGDWVEKIASYFQDNLFVSGVTGYGQTRVGITNKYLSKAWSYAYFSYCKAYFGVNVLWGANMALTRSAWQEIKNLTHNGNYSGDIHEDQDLSLALISTGRHIAIYPELEVSVDFGDSQYFDKIWRYNKMRINTKQAHKNHSRSKSPCIKLHPIYKRFYWRVTTAPFFGMYFVFTMLNSGKRQIIEASAYSRILGYIKK